MTPEEIIHKYLTINAIQNLEDAKNDLARRPNRAAFQVYAAIELVLKARLVLEGWTKIVTSRNIDLRRFQNGELNTVHLHVAQERLKDAGCPVPNTIFEVFDDLRMRRNKAMHFYPLDLTIENAGDLTSELQEARSLSWNALNKLRDLMVQEWSPHFDEFADKLRAIRGPSLDTEPKEVG